MEYPDRPPFFAMRFLRLLTKSAAMMHLGMDGFALLMVIVGQEDACRYTRPVSFWNTQLATLLGMRGADEHGIRRVRDRCIKAGWLQYRAGNKQLPAAYFVTIPAAVNLLSDSTCDEAPQENRANTAAIPAQRRQESGENPAGKRQESGENPAPSSPTPFPIPIPKDMGDELFILFWDCYGLKKDKADAIKAWKKLSEADKRAAIDGIPAYKATIKDPQYTKHPARYIRARTWEDEIPARKLTQADCPHPSGSSEFWTWVGINCPDTVM